MFQHCNLKCNHLMSPFLFKISKHHTVQGQFLEIIWLSGSYKVVDDRVFACHSGFAANTVAKVTEHLPDYNLNTASHIFHPAGRKRKRKTAIRKRSSSTCFLSGRARSASPSASARVRTKLLIFPGEFCIMLSYHRSE